MRNVLIILLILLLLSAGCLTPVPGESAPAKMVLVTPSSPFPVFEGKGEYTYLVRNDSPLSLNFSLGCVRLASGNATPLHRLMGTSELVYVIGGSAQIRSDDETIVLQAGELALLREGVLQSIEAVGPG